MGWFTKVQGVLFFSKLRVRNCCYFTNFLSLLVEPRDRSGSQSSPNHRDGDLLPWSFREGSCLLFDDMLLCIFYLSLSLEKHVLSNWPLKSRWDRNAAKWHLFVWILEGLEGTSWCFEAKHSGDSRDTKEKLSKDTTASYFSISAAKWYSRGTR